MGRRQRICHSVMASSYADYRTSNNNDDNNNDDNNSENNNNNDSDSSSDTTMDNMDERDLLKSRLLVKRHLQISPALKKSLKKKKKSSSKHKSKKKQERSQEQQQRQAEYEEMIRSDESTNVWSFESLFPQPVYDAIQIKNDLYGVAERDANTTKRRLLRNSTIAETAATTTSSDNDDDNNVFTEPQKQQQRRFWNDLLASKPSQSQQQQQQSSSDDGAAVVKQMATTFVQEDDDEASSTATTTSNPTNATTTTTMMDAPNNNNKKINPEMTERVQGAVYGIGKVLGNYEYYDYDESTTPEAGGVPKIRQVLKINADRLTYLAKRDLSRNRLDDAKLLYEECLEIDPRDGRPYLGLSQIAKRRGDYETARRYLEEGLATAGTSSFHPTTGQPEYKGNPYLLQALGCLEEECGYLQKAESYFVSAIASRPCHAPSYVALALLRIRKFKHPASAGRTLLQKAAWELEKAQLPPSAHVYTTWAALEYQHAGNVRRARSLFQTALEIDPQCSAAWLQWGVMECHQKDYEKAAECFSSGLQYDQRNSRLLQAFAILETKRGHTREAILLFEKALKANPRDAGVLQAYACFVSKLGDYDSARSLLQRGVQVNKRHAPLWQAWGVLELRQGNTAQARKLFQDGIWNCASRSGTNSGGHACARLWQAWGVLEHKEGDRAAARQCFHRALDADPRNVATLTAWTLLEAEEATGGNTPPQEARLIFEREYYCIACC